MMQVFEKFNVAGPDACPVCNTRGEVPVVLVPIDGTEDGEGNVRAAQVHFECINLQMNSSRKVIYQPVAQPKPLILQ